MRNCAIAQRRVNRVNGRPKAQRRVPNGAASEGAWRARMRAFAARFAAIAASAGRVWRESSTLGHIRLWALLASFLRMNSVVSFWKNGRIDRGGDVGEVLL